MNYIPELLEIHNVRADPALDELNEEINDPHRRADENRGKRLKELIGEMEGS